MGINLYQGRTSSPTRAHGSAGHFLDLPGHLTILFTAKEDHPAVRRIAQLASEELEVHPQTS